VSCKPMPGPENWNLATLRQFWRQLLQRVLERIAACLRLLTTKHDPATGIVTDLEAKTATYQGKTYPLDFFQLLLLDVLNGTPGNWLSTYDILQRQPKLTTYDRLDRLRQAMPAPFKTLVESKRGKGYRLNSLA